MVEEVKKNNEGTFRIVCGILGVISIFVLFLIKYNSTTFSWSGLLIGIFVVIVVFVLILVIYHFVFAKNKKEEIEDATKIKKLVDPITIEQARELVQECLVNKFFGDYVTKIEHEEVREYGKGVRSLIYTAIGKTYYSNQDVYILINLHSPHIRKSILFDVKPHELEIARSRLADYPEEVLPTRNIINENQLLGTRQIVVEPIKKEEKTEEPKKEDKL